MKKLSASFSVFFTLILVNLSAQDKPEWTKVFAKINGEVLANSKAYSSLKQSTETIGHRLTGSENGKKAEEFAGDVKKKMDEMFKK